MKLRAETMRKAGIGIKEARFSGQAGLVIGRPKQRAIKNGVDCGLPGSGLDCTFLRIPPIFFWPRYECFFFQPDCCNSHFLTFRRNFWLRWQDLSTVALAESITGTIVLFLDWVFIWRDCIFWDFSLPFHVWVFYTSHSEAPGRLSFASNYLQAIAISHLFSPNAVPRLTYHTTALSAIVHCIF